MADIKDAFVEQSHVIAKVFPEEMDMFYLFVDRALEDVVSCSKRITLREHLKLTTRYFWKGFRICQFTAGSSPRTRSITILEHHVHGIDVCARYHQCIDRR